MHALKLINFAYSIFHRLLSFFITSLETGTRWKDLLLVALLLTAIIGSWYAYQQNKNAKFHLRRMAKDMEGLHKAEVALQEMQRVNNIEGILIVFFVV